VVINKMHLKNFKAFY